MSSEPSPMPLHRASCWQGLVPYAVALLGALVTIAAFFPGYMSPDSLYQLQQGKNMEFGDLHPPLMAWFWGKLDFFWPGPAPMLVLQNVFFWVGAALLFTAFLKSRLQSSFAVLAFGFFPAVFLLLSTIWKDIGMVSCFLMGIGLLTQLQLGKCTSKNVRRVLYFVILFFFFIAIGIRHNALPPAIPLLMWFMYLCTSHLALSKTKKLHFVGCFVAALSIGFSFFAINGYIGKTLTKEKTVFPIQQVLMYDLLNISIRREENILPPYAYTQHGSSFNLSDLKKLYHPITVIQMFDGAEGRRTLTWSSSTEEIQILKQTWMNAVLENPKHYLLGRLTTLNHMLAFWKVPTCYSYHRGIDGTEYTISAPKWNSSVHKRYSIFDGTFLYRPWIYLALNFVCLLALFKSNDPRKGIVAAVSLSGIFYTLPYLLVSTGCDFRLTWWTTCSAILSALMCLGMAFTGWKKAALPN